MNISLLEISLWMLSAACFVMAVVIRGLAARGECRSLPAEEKGVISIEKAQEIESRFFERTAAKVAEEIEQEKGKVAPRTDRSGSGISPEELREKNDKNVADILCQQHLITKEILGNALEHQKKKGGTLIQFLLQYGYIDEKQLAQCVSTQFKVPYLPLDAYEISDDIVSAVPVDIAEKYWVMPVDRQGDSLMLVMINPLDTKAIKELEELIGLEIIPFVGVISEISAALRNYYRIFVKEQPTPMPTGPVYFIDTQTYTGIERRSSIRYNSRISVNFPVEGHYRKSQTINVSRQGFAFASDEPLPLGLILTIEVNLPQEVSALPISAVTQVIRCVSRGEKAFEIGVKTLKISKAEVGLIINYASRHIEV